ncbi:uncharacterized protein PG986_003783 [Apiospora aurea]|uniref:Uncharacterized protein n=1 Tax=Apiospora aurea TaxID=335848 RepID=A0ABR1QSN5_9PEZI
MSASFSFGSFGDIITTAQLVWRLSRALSDRRGSAPEFRELVKELYLFYGARSDVSMDELKGWLERRSTTQNNYGYVETSLESEFHGSEDVHRILPMRQNMVSPDIFKRVRFLSRWEGRDDSRGALRVISFNDIQFWGFSQNGWIPETKFQLDAMTFTHLCLSEIPGWETPEKILDKRAAFGAVFAGYKKTTSIPLIMIISEKPMLRKYSLTTLRGLEVVKSSRIGVMAFHPLVLGSEEYWRQELRSCQMNSDMLVERLGILQANRGKRDGHTVPNYTIRSNSRS